MVPPGLSVVAPMVTQLREGTEVSGVFACTRKERLLTRSGAPYLLVELRDRTGTITGRGFREVDRFATAFERGDLVRVRGRVERFRDELQVELTSIARADDAAADPERFLPVAYRDRDELEGFLEHLVDQVTDRSFRELLDVVLGDEALRAELRRAPCTRGGHHAYLGGLLEHTVAVGMLALETADLHRKLERDLLLTAAVVHDIGKTREFTYGAEIGLSEEGRMLGHLSLGEAILAPHVARLDDTRRLALMHCVLGHHGPDALPGRRFRSVEALTLYRLNTLDATVKAALEHGLQD